MKDENINESLELEENADYVVLTMDDGTQHNFYFEDEFDYKDKKYLCISPAEEIEDLPEGELLIYEVNDEDDDYMLKPIEDEKLLEEVYNEYCRRYDEEMEGCDCGCEHDHCDCCDDDDYDDDDFDFDEDEDIYEVVCPTCGDSIMLNEQMVEEGSMSCPNCGELLEFDLEDEDEEEDPDKE